jgi:hypothetical protein
MPLPVDAAHAEVFDLEEFLDAVFEGLGDAPDAADVAAAGKDIRGSFSGSRPQQ